MRKKTRKITITAVCLIAVIGALPVFASGSSEGINGENALWYQAAEITADSASVLPESKTVIWEELSPSGSVLSSEEVTVFYSEAEAALFMADEGENGRFVDGQKLKIDAAGDMDAFVKRGMINDGLFWTPFDDDVDNEDVTVSNTGRIELINGNECSVFAYTLYRDAAQYGYSFEETVRDNRVLIEDYEDPESNSIIRVEGFVWIDGNGIMRQLESNTDCSGVDYKETIKYDYDGSKLFPVESILGGTIEKSSGDMVVFTNFSAAETMEGYWIATDFAR